MTKQTRKAQKEIRKGCPLCLHPIDAHKNRMCGVRIVLQFAGEDLDFGQCKCTAQVGKKT